MADTKLGARVLIHLQWAHHSSRGQTRADVEYPWAIGGIRWSAKAGDHGNERLRRAADPPTPLARRRKKQLLRFVLRALLSGS